MQLTEVPIPLGSKWAEFYRLKRSCTARATNRFPSIQGVGGPIGELDSSCASSPLTEKFAIPGAIIVSGMTQDLDHTIISVALQELLGFVWFERHAIRKIGHLCRFWLPANPISALLTLPSSLSTSNPLLRLHTMALLQTFPRNPFRESPGGGVTKSQWRWSTALNMAWLATYLSRG